MQTAAPETISFPVLHTVAVLLTVLHIIGAGVFLIWLAA